MPISAARHAAPTYPRPSHAAPVQTVRRASVGESRHGSGRRSDGSRGSGRTIRRGRGVVSRGRRVSGDRSGSGSKWAVRESRIYEALDEDASVFGKGAVVELLRVEVPAPDAAQGSDFFAERREKGVVVHCGGNFDLSGLYLGAFECAEEDEAGC